jgi:hypothetical protein
MDTSVKDIVHGSFHARKECIFGGYFMPYVALNYASGELVADLSLAATNLSAGAGGSGFADMYVQPLNLGWHLKRAHVVAGYAFTAPVGRYTAGASDDVGSGYWGNNITSGTTFYITKNKGTSANLATDWEIHGQRQTASTPSGQFSEKTPGQAFTDEWGVGQVLPLKKHFSRLLQLGLVGYDQWQVSSNGGTVIVAGIPVNASTFRITQSMALVFNPVSFCPRRTWLPSSSTTTSIRPRLVRRDARSCSDFHGRCEFPRQRPRRHESSMCCLERKTAVPNAEPAPQSFRHTDFAYEDGEVSRFSQLRSRTVARKKGY